jgi:hypothetical protein
MVNGTIMHTQEHGGRRIWFWDYYIDWLYFILGDINKPVKLIEIYYLG